MLNGKILYPTDSVKYLRVKIDIKLNWKSHVNTIATKLKFWVLLIRNICHLLTQGKLEHYMKSFSQQLQGCNFGSNVESKTQVF